MKVRANKEVFGHNFVYQDARASLGERQARVQKVPGPSTRPGGVGPRDQKPLSDKHFHEAFTWRPHASWPRSRSGKVSPLLLGERAQLLERVWIQTDGDTTREALGKPNPHRLELGLIVRGAMGVPECRLFLESGK